LLLSSSCYCRVEEDETRYKNSLESLLTPTMCQLKLICAISQSKDNSLKSSNFMRGISVLAGYKGNITVPLLLERAIKTGEVGGSCHTVAPSCQHSDGELLTALADMGLTGSHLPGRRLTGSHLLGRRLTGSYLPGRSLTGSYLPGRRRMKREVYRQYRRPQTWYRPGQYRRQGLGLGSLVSRQGLGLGRMPPILRPEQAGRRGVCRACDQRSTVCTVYSVGTYAGCTGVWLVAGLPGQIACNVATAPGSIGCGVNTLHCYMSGCGLINLPRLP